MKFGPDGGHPAATRSASNGRTAISEHFETPAAPPVKANAGRTRMLDTGSEP